MHLPLHPMQGCGVMVGLCITHIGCHFSANLLALKLYPRVCQEKCMKNEKRNSSSVESYMGGFSSRNCKKVLGFCSRFSFLNACCQAYLHVVVDVRRLRAFVVSQKSLDGSRFFICFQMG